MDSHSIETGVVRERDITIRATTLFLVDPLAHVSRGLLHFLIPKSVASDIYGLEKHYSFHCTCTHSLRHPARSFHFLQRLGVY
jgi:hypothetical protein